MIWLSWSKLSEKVKKWHSNFSRPSVFFFFFFFLSYWLKHVKYYLYIISNTLQIILVWNWIGGVWGGCVPSEAMKTLQFSNLICVIWCILFGNIPKRRKDHHLDDSLYSDSLNRIDIKVQLWLIWYDTGIKNRSYILTSQSDHVFSGLFCLFFLSSCFF